MEAGKHYDVVIIGTGAGGGTLAYHLAPSGKKILLLERGAFLPREKQNWDVEDVFVQNRYVSQDTWYDKNGKPFQSLQPGRSPTRTWSPITPRRKGFITSTV
jgi:choline dehydrogenase-like flavoprotein